MAEFDIIEFFCFAEPQSKETQGLLWRDGMCTLFLLENVQEWLGSRLTYNNLLSSIIITYL